MSKKPISITRTVTNLVTGESIVYKQVMNATIYINVGINSNGDGRFFVDGKQSISVTVEEYEQLMAALSEHINIIV